MSGELYQVQLSYAVFGIAAKEDVVTDAAPIGRWMIGKTLDQVKSWVTSRRGEVVMVNRFYGDEATTSA